MNLSHAGRAHKLSHIERRDARSGHDRDPAPGLIDQFADHRGAFRRGRFAAGGEDALKAERYGRLQRRFEIRDQIESAVQGDAQASRVIDQGREDSLVQFAGRPIGADHHARKTRGPRGVDIASHDIEVERVIDEIPRAGPDHRIGWRDLGGRQPHQAGARRQP